MAGLKGRPYFQSSITELEKLFSLGKADAALLKALKAELRHRETDRARRLRDKVDAALGQGATVAQGAKVSPTPPQPEQQRAAAIATSVTSPTPVAPISPADRPAQPNRPENVLAAWTALEALSPQTYRKPEELVGGDRWCVADFERDALPWTLNERSRRNRQLYYQIVLGSVPMDRATEALTRAFGADEERVPRIREKAAIAAILVDKQGVPLEDNAIAISSFAWALPLALKLELGALGNWPKAEPRLIEGIEKIIRRQDGKGRPLALDRARIAEAFDWLRAELGLAEEMAERPAFALRVYHYFRAQNPPEVSLLNSFFLGDLARATGLVAEAAAPKGLRRYLGIDRPEAPIRLSGNPEAIEAAVAPARIPAARWPGNGGHPLVLLQQAAVNLARTELAGSSGILAVNGPPGTGKTTLLRDIVAATVLDRALAMAAFADPESAFSPSGEKVSAGPKAFFHLYRLDPSLKGHEMLVASSNNKAVENVSRELPAASAVGRDVRYFRAVSDLVHTAPDASEDEEEAGAKVEPVQTWGLIAAVLGNARNRFNFQRRFWWDDELAFRLYLKAAKGDSVVREIRDAEGELIERRNPRIVTEESPPTPQMAKANWRRARDKLLALKREVDADLQALEAVRQRCLRLAELRSEIVGEAALIVDLQAVEARLADQRAEAERVLADARAAETGHADVLAVHRGTRPGFWAWLFRAASWRAWQAAHRPLADALAAARGACSLADDALAKVEAALWDAARERETVQVRLDGLRAREAEQALVEAKDRAVLGERMVDPAFFARGHDDFHLLAPWVPDEIHRKREDLFIAALEVHRAFIDASAQKMLHNLSVLMDVFSGGAPADPAKRALLPDLWSTLFLAVPVLSTTFASVERMLGDLPPESLGWLLIDEAGQALPQAAAGAILRARRTVVVGDPLQIPPVVSLPERLNANICAFFRVDQRRWAAPEASAQTLADAASRYTGAFDGDQGERIVGVPLLVHRRCQDPMFSISNIVAYDGQMVHAPPPRKRGSVGEALGESTWFDIDGDADSKWCPAEGEQVVRMLKTLAQQGVREPDLFIITPFRIVAQELRRRLGEEKPLFAQLGIAPGGWLKDRVGTIHTVQGREADSVILVLGAPMAGQNGARNWASGTPNIFNVAVSRAKQNLYVVGSRGAWEGTGHARTVARCLPASAVR